MEKEQIEALILRFLDGDTSLDEEKRLYAYFARTKEVDEALRPYAEYFRDLATLQPIEATPIPHITPQRPRRWVRTVVSMAASVALLVGGVWGYRLHKEHVLAQRYGGSYMIVNGKRCDDLLKIEDHIKQTLRDGHQVEQLMDGQELIDQAEQEVLQSVGDSAQRQQLKDILS